MRAARPTCHRHALLTHSLLSLLLLFSTTSYAWYQTPMLSGCASHHDVATPDTADTGMHGGHAGHHAIPHTGLQPADPDCSCADGHCAHCDSYLAGYFQSLVASELLCTVPGASIYAPAAATPIAAHSQRPPLPPPRQLL